MPLLQSFKLSDTLEIRDEIMFKFYLGLPHIMAYGSTTHLHHPYILCHFANYAQHKTLCTLTK